jgi:hypothetical protein
MHFDLALNTKRHGDRAGIALARIARSWIEREVDPEYNRYERVVRSFEVPLAAQIAARVGEQIYLGSICAWRCSSSRSAGSTSPPSRPTVSGRPTSPSS